MCCRRKQKIPQVDSLFLTTVLRFFPKQPAQSGLRPTPCFCPANLQLYFAAPFAADQHGDMHYYKWLQ